MEDILFYGSAIVVGSTMGWLIAQGLGVLFHQREDRRVDEDLKAYTEKHRQNFRAEWVAQGVRAAANGSPRFISTAPWIQEFYDEGYDSVTIIKEAANV